MPEQTTDQGAGPVCAPDAPAPAGAPAQYELATGSVLGRSGAIVPLGWALYNAVWVGVLGGFDGSRPTGNGPLLALYLYSGAVAITVLFAAAVTISGWRHPVEPRRHFVGARADAGIYGAFGVCFAGLSFVYGSWWAPVGAVLLVIAGWLAVRDHRDRRVPLD